MSFFKKVFFKTTNPYILMVVKLLIALLLLLITQWLFWILNNSYFTVSSTSAFFSILWGSIIYAVSATLFLQVPFIALNISPFNFRYNKYYQGVANFFFIACTLIGLIPNIIDIIYYRFTYRRITADIFQYLGVGGDFKDLIPAFFKDYWPYFIAFALVCFLMTYLVKRFVLLEKRITTPSGYLKNIVLSIITIGLCIIGMRGIAYKPLRVITAAKYTSGNNVALVVNTPASIIFTFGKKGVERINYFSSEKELESVFNPVQTPSLVFDTVFDANPTTNVVIFILESFSAEYMGCLNGGKESFTPFLDSLAQESLVFEGMSNGKRSIEAIPSVLSGLPSIMNEAYITSSYSGNEINSLAEMLKKYNYFSAFFHGAYNGSMGFDAFARMAGFDKYYGKTEYNNDKDADGTWGIYDEPFLQFMTTKMSTFKQPFLSTVFTISSHHPYKLPEQYIGKFKKGKLPILEVVMYTDHALKRFFETASKQSWFSNTLFIITGDHTAQAMSQFYNNSYGMYQVPMLFYKPNSQRKGFVKRMVQQSDILPSVIDYLSLNEKCVAFGNSAFNLNLKPFHISFANGYYQLIRDNYLIKFSDEITEAYNIKADPLLKTNLKNTPLPEIMESERFLKAFIQQYNNRIIDNKLVAQ